MEIAFTGAKPLSIALGALAKVPCFTARVGKLGEQNTEGFAYGERGRHCMNTFQVSILEGTTLRPFDKLRAGRLRAGPSAGSGRGARKLDRA
jgi:hypothetical protein